MARPLPELLSPGDEGWTSITTWIAASPRPVEVLDALPGSRADVLLALQVTTRSVLGATAWHSAGLLLDHGWLRLLGGTGSDLPDLLAANEERLVPGIAPSYLVIALDVLGGRFAVNGGALPAELGEVAYFGPDNLDWLPTGLSHSAFVEWALTGDTGAFYADLRWDGWESEVQRLPHASLLCRVPPAVHGGGEGRGRDLSSGCPVA